MNSASVKESRAALRVVQTHLLAAHAASGAERESLGLVDVIYHPQNPIPDLNYVTPRRNTAWVSGSFIEQGLAWLREKGRTGRVEYIEGLFPPLFAKTLRDLGLEAERETPLLIYSAEGFNGVVPPAPAAPTLGDGIRLHLVNDQRGMELWWYVWRNAVYDVLTLGVEPVTVGRDMAAVWLGQQFDLVLYRYHFPVGVARVSIQRETQSAHIVGIALLREAREYRLLETLYIAALREALARGCTLIFAPGEDEADRTLARHLGFIDVGSILCYAAAKQNDDGSRTHEFLAEPVLTLR